MSATSPSTIYFGNVVECTTLIGGGGGDDASNAVVFDFETPIEALPRVAKCVYVILSALSDEQLLRRPAVCAALKRHLPGVPLECRTAAQLRATRAVATYNATHDTTSFIGVQLPLDEPVLPCATWASDLSGKSTREWYHNVLNFALRKECVSRLICVLHGPSGVGKTLTISRIEAILRRDARPERLLSISAASVSPGNCERLMLDMIAHARAVNNILVLDDFDAGVPERMQRLLETLACRRIVICNDPFAKANLTLRRKTHYYLEKVNRVHTPSLLAYLKRHFLPTPGGGSEDNERKAAQLAQIAEAAQGDMRVALTNARWAALGACLPASVEAAAVEKDYCRVGEMPCDAVLRCSRAANVGAACERAFGDADVYTPAELLFENHTHYNPHDLETAAALVEMASFGDTYDRAQQDSLREGSDANCTDKRLHFELSFALPCQLLADVTKRKWHQSGKPEMRFRARALAESVRENGSALRNIAMRRHLLEHELPLAMRVQQLANQVPRELLCLTPSGENLDGAHAYAAMTFGDVRGKQLTPALGVLRGQRRCATGADAGQSEERAAAAALRVSMRAFARTGKLAEDFLYHCQRHVALFVLGQHTQRSELQLPPTRQIEETFEHVTGKKTTTTTAENLLGDTDEVDENDDNDAADVAEEEKKKEDDDDEEHHQSLAAGSKRSKKRHASTSRAPEKATKKPKRAPAAEKTTATTKKKHSIGLLDVAFKKQTLSATVAKTNSMLGQ